MSDRAKQLAWQRESMEKQRFGDTRANILKEKGAKCAMCGSTKDLVIDHISGGGRHDTERGLLRSGKTHNKKNMRVLCRSCAGQVDRMDFIGGRGSNTKGNSNNPSQ